jgi:hypothetical protein
VQANHGDNAAGFTVADLTARWRVGSDKIHAWIRRGELQALNTAGALCGRPRWVVLPESVAEFERGSTSNPSPNPTRRKKRTDAIDFFPD